MSLGSERVMAEVHDVEGEPPGICLRWYNRSWCMPREDAELIYKKLGDALKALEADYPRSET